MTVKTLTSRAVEVRAPLIRLFRLYVVARDGGPEPDTYIRRLPGAKIWKQSCRDLVI